VPFLSVLVLFALLYLLGIAAAFARLAVVKDTGPATER
jgi:hypothetical protein